MGEHLYRCTEDYFLYNVYILVDPHRTWPYVVCTNRRLEPHEPAFFWLVDTSRLVEGPKSKIEAYVVVLLNEAEAGSLVRVDPVDDPRSSHDSLKRVKQDVEERLQDFLAEHTRSGFCSLKYSSLRAAALRS